MSIRSGIVASLAVIAGSAHAVSAVDLSITPSTNGIYSPAVATYADGVAHTLASGDIAVAGGTISATAFGDPVSGIERGYAGVSNVTSATLLTARTSSQVVGSAMLVGSGAGPQTLTVQVQFDASFTGSGAFYMNQAQGVLTSSYIYPPTPANFTAYTVTSSLAYSNSHVAVSGTVLDQPSTNAINSLQTTIGTQTSVDSNYAAARPTLLKGDSTGMAGILSIPITVQAGQAFSLSFALNTTAQAGSPVTAAAASAVTDALHTARLSFVVPQGDSIVAADGSTFLSGAVVTAVPEPASWAMLLLGLGSVFGWSRRRAGASRRP